MLINHKMMRKIIVIFLIIFSSPCCKIQWVKDISQFDFQDGDILLQHIPSRLGSVIADVTNSQYSHCGIIVNHKGTPLVLEAIGPVKYTHAKAFINRGAFGRFSQYRSINLSGAQIAGAIREGEKLLGKPYDIQYEMDEKKIYCSELVYKAYLRGAGIEIGKKEALGSLNWKGHEDFIRYITGGDLPLDRVMVTPDSLSTSPRVRLVYTSFPPKSGEPLYSTIDLAGTWSGDYTIMDLGRATAVLKFRPDTRKPDNQAVILQSGYIGYGGSKIEINSFSIETFRNAREFTAEITDARGIKAKISAKIKDRGTRLLGTWKDSRGNSGVFSLEKISR